MPQPCGPRPGIAWSQTACATTRRWAARPTRDDGALPTELLPENVHSPHQPADEYQEKDEPDSKHAPESLRAHPAVYPVSGVKVHQNAPQSGAFGTAADSWNWGPGPPHGFASRRPRTPAAGHIAAPESRRLQLADRLWTLRANPPYTPPVHLQETNPQQVMPCSTIPPPAGIAAMESQSATLLLDSAGVSILTLVRGWNASAPSRCPWSSATSSRNYPDIPDVILRQGA